ncbi:imelysin family protein [Halopseudomonas maritima]|uniref:imelysin family protein n=1 Tax=Halopseudomonas maritima TaxID=2918528 RepID=UPI001EEB405A|nr:imelysin family protein [Halopseudomonas maritima]UJJ31525.1 imelysin family protein [Halopseudomonas maritima]
MKAKTTLLRLPLVTALTLGLSAQALAETPRAAWHAQIGHGYEQLASNTASFEQLTSEYCAEPTDAGLLAVQEQWLAAFSSWQAVRFVDFGPIEQNTRAWKFQFWPDPKNLTAAKARYWLGGDKAIDVDALSRDSVAIQGFPAAEYLLFDPQITEGERALPAERTCTLLTAISGNLKHNAAGLNADWGQLQSRYLEVADYNNGTLTSAMHALEIMADWRLAAPLGVRGTGKPNPYLADAWRSEQSLVTLRASLQGLADYFVPGLNLLMAENDAPELAEQFSSQLNKTLAHFDSLPTDITPLLETEEGIASLTALLEDVRATGAVLTGPIASKLAIVRGFNSSDGD